MKQRRGTLEEDLRAGPIIQKEIYYHDFSDKGINPPEWKERPDETHILVDIYRYRIIVGQFDTTSQVWDTVRDSFHSIEVTVPRAAAEKALGVKTDSDLLEKIEKGFPGPETIDKWISFCRNTMGTVTVVENGFPENDLIRKYL